MACSTCWRAALIVSESSGWLNIRSTALAKGIEHHGCVAREYREQQKSTAAPSPSSKQQADSPASSAPTQTTALPSPAHPPWCPPSGISTTSTLASSPSGGLSSSPKDDQGSSRPLVKTMLVVNLGVERGFACMHACAHARRGWVLAKPQPKSA